MQVGDLIRFRQTGLVGTVVALGHGRPEGSLISVLVFKCPGNIANPSQFRLPYLQAHAEVISASR